MQTRKIRGLLSCRYSVKMDEGCKKEICLKVYYKSYHPLWNKNEEYEAFKMSFNIFPCHSVVCATMFWHLPDYCKDTISKYSIFFLLVGA